MLDAGVELFGPFKNLKNYSVTSWLDITKNVKISHYWYESGSATESLMLENFQEKFVKVKHFKCGHEHQFGFNFFCDL